MKISLFVPFVSQSSFYSTIKNRTRLSDPNSSILEPDGRSELVALERKRAKQSLRLLQEDIKAEEIEKEKEIKKAEEKVAELTSDFKFGKTNKPTKQKNAKGKAAKPEEDEEKPDSAESDEPESEEPEEAESDEESSDESEEDSGESKAKKQADTEADSEDYEAADAELE